MMNWLELGQLHWQKACIHPFEITPLIFGFLIFSMTFKLMLTSKTIVGMQSIMNKQNKDSSAIKQKDDWEELAHVVTKTWPCVCVQSERVLTCDFTILDFLSTFCKVVTGTFDNIVPTSLKTAVRMPGSVFVEELLKLEVLSTCNWCTLIFPIMKSSFRHCYTITKWACTMYPINSKYFHSVHPKLQMNDCLLPWD